jgi:REP element-mobilizing transposase RayT
MPRTVRIEYAGAVYYVMCRGDQREAIFLEEADRELFLGTLAEMCARTGLVVHGDVLMTNHYHLPAETPQPNLVEGMKWFQGTYTQRFNARNRLSGHLIQGRYKAVPIEAADSCDFRPASDHIDLNPARARLLASTGPDLLSYRWSSSPLFVGSGR